MKKPAARRARPKDWSLVRIKPMLCRFGGIGRSTFYDQIDEGLLPPLIHITPNVAGLPDYEVDEIQQARLAGKDDDAIRALVKELVADRATPTPNREDGAA